MEDEKSKMARYMPYLEDANYVNTIDDDLKTMFWFSMSIIILLIIFCSIFTFIMYYNGSLVI